MTTDDEKSTPSSHQRPEALDFEKAARFLFALANPIRLQVIKILMVDEQDVGSMVKVLPISQSALSQHLKILRDDGLVSTRRDAQRVIYSLASREAAAIVIALNGQIE